MNKTPRLFIMMFLQYFVQGAWNMTIGAVLATYGLREIVGTTYSVLGIATIISPLFIGMLADRFVPSQKVMGLLHIINAGVLLAIPAFVVSGNVPIFLTLVFVVGLLFYPTTALANSISFRNIDGVKLFPIVRVFGTFGFMTIGFVMGWTGIFDQVTTFKVASMSSVVLGLYCFTLPNTPPASKGKKISLRDLFFLDALSLFKDRNFTIFMLSTFVLMIPKTAYSAYVPVYLKALGFNSASMMQIATVVEVIFMFILAYALRRFGFKKIILCGAIFWVVRSLLLSQAAVSADTLYFIIAALVLQGICWDFFFTAGDIYVDRKAGIEIKAQAQGLRFIVSNGFGVFMASSLCNYIYNNVVTDTVMERAAIQWQQFWIYPAIVAAAVVVAFFLFFKDTLVDKPLNEQSNA